MNKRAVLCAFSVLMLIALVLPIAVFGQGMERLAEPWEGTPAWLNFEHGKVLYAQKDFGQALVAFDRAITARRDAFAEALKLYDTAMQSAPARKAGNSINAALAAFAAEDFLPKDYQALVRASEGSFRRLFVSLKAERISEAHRAFLGVLLSVMEYRPLDKLSDSLHLLGQEIQTLSAFPEAEFWKGKVFAIEGELALAERQYLRAFDDRASLEVPEERYDMLYALADLYRTEGDMAAWENVIKRILADDPIAGDPALDPYLREAMMNTLRQDGYERFMVLYRIAPGFSFQANALVAEFYMDHGRAQAVLHAAVACNMIATRAMAMIRERDRDYRWLNLADFRIRASAVPAVSAYLDDMGFNRLLLVLADALYQGGSRTHALSLWRDIAVSAQAPYSAVALKRIADPQSAIRTRP